MEERPTGARVALTGDARAVVVEAGPGAVRLGVAALVSRGDRRSVKVATGESPWRLRLDEDQDATVRIVLYMVDETQTGRVEDRGPLTIAVGDTSVRMAPRADRHGAVVLGEIYHRGGRPMLRVGGDGYAFGILSLCRREGYPVDAFETRSVGEEQGRPAPRPEHDDGRRGRDRDATGSGSGVVVAPEHVVTNAHVVRGSGRQTVHSDGRALDARVIMVDEEHDLALLHVSGLAGRPLVLRRPEATYLGEPVTAAGYPLRDILNADPKITHGNLSGMRGTRGDLASFQFTAPIASGSSGGAVVDGQGRVVGIIAAMLSHQAMRDMGASSEATNFGIKASLVVEMLVAAGVDGFRVEDGGAGRDGPAQVSRRIQQGIVGIVLT